MDKLPVTAKIPCILATAMAMHVAHTAPTSITPKDSSPSTTTLGNKYLSFVVANMGYIKGIFWGGAIAEVAALIAGRSPSSPISQQIIATVLKKGAGTDLRLTPLSAAGMLLIVGGGLLRYQCYRVMKRFFTFEVTIRDGHQLITAGPYSVVRHPGYTGALAEYIGMACWFGSRGSWLRESGVLDTVAGRAIAVTFAAVHTLKIAALMLRVPEEDKMLRNEFGKKWDEWARDVPSAVIPFIF